MADQEEKDSEDPPKVSSSKYNSDEFIGPPKLSKVSTLAVDSLKTQ